MNLLITGASGMVGEGVLHTALNNKAVSSVIVIGRKTCQYTHPKLKELIVNGVKEELSKTLIKPEPTKNEKDALFSSSIISNNRLCGIHYCQLFLYCPIGKRNSFSAG